MNKGYEKLEKELEKAKFKVKEQQVVIDRLTKIKVTPLSLGYTRSRFNAPNTS